MQATAPRRSRVSVRLFRAAAVCLAGASAIACHVPAASALEAREPVGAPFGSSNAFEGIAVDQSTGNVFVVNNRA
ncbi:MAG TPA: hypothetical protein VNV37_04100, partial [Solirubrobacteraceae bacterium]|nr:hypothetical protein [Solirubrobacteraceae bacterium]